MQLVFSQTIREASDEGALTLGKVFLRELLDLPLAALHERLRERQAQYSAQRNHVETPITRLSRSEMLLALAVFLVPAGLVLLNSTSSSLLTKIVPPTMLVLLLIGSVAGLIKRFPRWSLPYYGVAASAIVFLFLFQGNAQRLSALLASRFVFQPNDELNRLLLVIFWDGMVWLSLLVLVSLSVLLLSRVPNFVPLVQRMWEDWTRLSYLLYGSSMLALVLTLDAYNYDAIITLAALLCLTAGAWGYLRNNHPKRRFLALMAGLTLAMTVAVTSNGMLSPQFDWMVWLRISSHVDGRWLDPGQGLVGWAWMMIVITLPGLLRLLPRPHSSKLVE
jgi:hypothetical protein